MTDDWDFYFLNVDNKPASMFVDLGAHRLAPYSDLSHMAYIRLEMKSPRDDGLSSQEEYDSLLSIEKAIEAHLVDDEADYLGRCTTNSCRDFFFYIAQPQNWAERVANCMRAFPTYRYEVGNREDAGWSTYFSYLYPSPSNRQTIENRRVCEALERNGDKLRQSREIDHWSSFSEAAGRHAFVVEAMQLGFAVRSLSELDKGNTRYVAQLWRTDIPALNTIDDVTLPLFNLAYKHGGEYDGWESIVVT
ncbi:DUF695 domain-containing protein [Sideroxydans lithotrophicus]|uniref:Uncharacterized protein n=1 Tax=Sideroxydans lithotrophicus (strain ES-1) TaxID=580332 RepID=D5CQW7_SIDLE|nr:DUF695 domain-containing protein [Sideroxydans lithotrophicus]ADE11353.1 protein of unknown function DUF1260 [Sideroxydans lithotrophicus ES-1]